MTNIINKIRLTNLLEYGLEHQMILDKVLKDDLKFLYDITYGTHHLTIATKDSSLIMSVHVEGFFRPTYKVIRYVNKPSVRHFKYIDELMTFILRKVSE